ncbi:recombinase family protein [Anaerotruncus colihominis]|uniref:recombinase family protein n=1 Tax=Anaerotruncus colihominis TaxID=169435 RepID=UPI003514D3AE
MTETAPSILVIPARPETAKERESQRQLRVAAYCRVSTKDEEQLTSYEAQQTYYTDMIMQNPNWTMAGIFADEGITGTSAAKRPEFLKLIRKCRQKKIDMVLVKSISRFARNTVDCLNYIRALKELGIAVVFEKENINTMDSESEMLLTLMGAFAQAESESMSANIKWGRRQAMREGKVTFQYKHLYAYERGEDDKPRVIPEQAEVVRRMFDSFLMGNSIRMIKAELEQDKIPAVSGGESWSEATIRSILKNEVYCGDVLLQKTYVSDCISKKSIKNTGQLPMYLIQNHHEGIVSRDKFNAVQAEFARRNAGRTPNKRYTSTGRSCYSGKYALTERLVCGGCGTLYRRCVWNKRGQKWAVWRCASRVDYGSKYCKQSPTLYEKPLQRAILAVLNSVMSKKEALAGQITDAMRMELLSLPGGTMSMTDIDRRLAELEQEFQSVFQQSREKPDGFMEYAQTFQRINEEAARLKEQRQYLLDQQQIDSAANGRIAHAMDVLNSSVAEITEWDESMIRQLVDTVTVLSEDRIRVRLYGGMEFEQELDQERS